MREDKIENRRIFEITKEFSTKAIDKCCEIEARIISNTDMDDATESLSYAVELSALKQKLGEQAPDNDRYVEVAVKYANTLAGVFSKVCDPSEIDPLVPKSASTDEVVSEYRRRGAKALADLCARQIK